MTSHSNDGAATSAHLRRAEAELTDSQIMVGSKANPELFSAIYRRHHDSIFRYIALRVGRQRAADLAADVFVRAFNARTRYDPSWESCRPWLLRFAINVVGDEIRRAERSENRRMALLVSVNQSIVDLTDVESRVDAAALGERLRWMLDQLPSADRDTLILFAAEEMPYADIAAILQIPVGTVRSRLSRARQRARSLLPELTE